MDDRGISVNQARIALQYLNDQVNGQTDEVKIIEESLATCQTRVKELRLELTRVQVRHSTIYCHVPLFREFSPAISSHLHMSAAIPRKRRTSVKMGVIAARQKSRNS